MSTQATWRARNTIAFAALAAVLGALPAAGAQKTVIGDKTLLACVALAALAQRGGSVLTIEKPGGVFDAIVFGEIAPGKWMPGSNGFKRARQFGVKVCCSPKGREGEAPAEPFRREGEAPAEPRRREETAIFYDAVAKKLKVDTRASGLTDGPKSIEAGPFALREGEPLRLRIFVDKSVVEVFANGRQAVMRRIYPSREDSIGVALFSTGGPATVTTLEAWGIMPSNPY